MSLMIIDNFDINEICESGQCFRMSKTEEGAIEVIAGGRYLLVSQNGSDVSFDCSDEEFELFWKHYFDLGLDYGKIIASIDKNDSYLINAANHGSGIRILNQDLWEMIISFIISQRSNIKRIRTCIKKLCEKYGEKHVINKCDGTAGEIEFYDFPTPEALMNANVEDIRALGVGYRDVYIKKAAEAVFTGQIDLEAVSKMEYKEAREELLKLFGVGEKVADCICLFALHHLDAFPRDTHIISIVDKQYNGEFPFDMYKGYAGVLQQYMFFYDLLV